MGLISRKIAIPFSGACLQFDRLSIRPQVIGDTGSSTETTSLISSLTTADTSYYQSDSETASVRVADDRTVDYGVPANNSASEQVVRVLKCIANCARSCSQAFRRAVD